MTSPAVRYGRRHRPSTELRRNALVRAATEIIGESGTAAATHRAIAAKAGVPLSTTSYFFASIASLLEAAIRQFTAERAAQLEALAAGLASGVSPDEIASLFASVLLSGERAAELAQIEAYLHAARTDNLRQPVAEAMDAFERVAVVALSAAGALRPHEGARAFVALADGAVMAHLARPRDDDEAVLREGLRSLFLAYAMEDFERAEWDRRLAGR